MIITIARKPLEGTVAQNCLNHACGSLNIDATRIGSQQLPKPCQGTGWSWHDKHNADQGYRETTYYVHDTAQYIPSTLGRWPANTILTQETVLDMGSQSGICPGLSGGGAKDNTKTGKESIPSFNRKPSAPFIRGDTGTASRFFKQVGKVVK